MEKVINPFAGRENYNCFGCSPDNHDGLQMEFYEEGEEVICYWQPKEKFQGYNSVLHGGIISTLIDEIASWYVFTKLKTSGMTSKLEVRFKKPVLINGGRLTLRARLAERKRNLAYIDVRLYNSQNELCSEGEAVYFILPKEKAKEMLLRYPVSE